jgi:gamma-butyrobetaine dioxygenase
MNAAATLKRLWSRPDLLHIDWADGTSSEYASLWLRDNLREDRDPLNGQRLVDIADLPEDPKIRSVAARDSVLTVEWQSEPRPAAFDLRWLRDHAAPRRSQTEFPIKCWLEGARLDAARDFARATLDEMRGDRALRTRWLARLLQDGIAFLEHVAATERGILDAAALLGRVAETNYGLVYDVRSVPQPENLAYSDLGLGLHTDNPYRDPVPGFQVLHALIASADGGESLFGDGFAIAEQLRSIDPQGFAVLTRTAVPFLYRSRDAELYAERPLIQLSCDGAVTAVHYNSRSMAPLPPSAGNAAFYAAYRRFAALLRDSRFQLQCRLRDGDLVVFDNLRTLHGRTAFSSAKYPRHLRGCYLTRDSVYSTAALLRRGSDSEISA